MKMSTPTFAALLLIASAPLALAQGTYTQIDAPGGAESYCYGIDTAGDITGGNVDSNGNYHGFLLRGGTYTTINYPGASWTLVYGLNDVGQVVGYSSTGFGFVYDVASQAFSEVSYPGATVTSPLSINNEGSIAGRFLNGNVEVGFWVAGSNYRQIAPLGATSTSLLGITASGELLGTAGNFNSFFNFRFDHGTYNRVAIPNAPMATVGGVNPAGNVIVGYYVPLSGGYAGFLFKNRILTILQFPGSTRTIAYGINSSGEVVGQFFDSSGFSHGFLWTPPADAVKK